MKTRIAILILLVALVSCSEKSKEETFQDKLVGVWKLTYVEAFGNEMTGQATQYMPCIMESTVELKSDGTFESVMPCAGSDAVTGQYFVSDPQILLQSESNTQTFHHEDGVLTTVLSVSASDFGISLPIPSLELTCKFEKR